MGFASHFFLLSLGTYAITLQRNTRRWDRSDGIAVLLFVGDRFARYTAVEAASVQKRLSSPQSANKQRTFSSIVRFIICYYLFCCGLYGTVLSCRFPLFFKKSSNFLPRYSCPLLVFRHLIFHVGLELFKCAESILLGFQKTRKRLPGSIVEVRDPIVLPPWYAYSIDPHRFE